MTTTMTAETWESAWETYIDALELLQVTRQNRHRPGHRRPWNNAKTAARRAVERLRKLDPEFCDRQGIE